MPHCCLAIRAHGSALGAAAPAAELGRPPRRTAATSGVPVWCWPRGSRLAAEGYWPVGTGHGRVRSSIAIQVGNGSTRPWLQVVLQPEGVAFTWRASTVLPAVASLRPLLVGAGAVHHRGHRAAHSPHRRDNATGTAAADAIPSVFAWLGTAVRARVTDRCRPAVPMAAFSGGLARLSYNGAATSLLAGTTMLLAAGARIAVGVQLGLRHVIAVAIACVVAPVSTFPTAGFWHAVTMRQAEALQDLRSSGRLQEVECQPMPRGKNSRAGHVWQEVHIRVGGALIAFFSILASPRFSTTAIAIAIDSEEGGGRAAQGAADPLHPARCERGPCESPDSTIGVGSLGYIWIAASTTSCHRGKERTLQSVRALDTQLLVDDIPGRLAVTPRASPMALLKADVAGRDRTELWKERIRDRCGRTGAVEKATKLRRVPVQVEEKLQPSANSTRHMGAALCDIPKVILQRKDHRVDYGVGVMPDPVRVNASQGTA
mmetsp:Transcript_36649/g.101801  ORF Transcript_36649/g.101801 Transcript_36649/m.101801 type:complete len:487 (-) Transcript_36649:1212-2672(-)